MAFAFEKNRKVQIKYFYKHNIISLSEFDNAVITHLYKKKRSFVYIVIFLYKICLMDTGIYLARYAKYVCVNVNTVHIIQDHFVQFAMVNQSMTIGSKSQTM